MTNNIKDRIELLEARNHWLNARICELEEALQDACDVAIWLSGLPWLRIDAWSHWESDARPKLYRAMEVLERKGQE